MLNGLRVALLARRTFFSFLSFPMAPLPRAGLRWRGIARDARGKLAAAAAGAGASCSTSIKNFFPKKQNFSNCKLSAITGQNSLSL